MRVSRRSARSCNCLLIRKSRILRMLGKSFIGTLCDQFRAAESRWGSFRFASRSSRTSHAAAEFGCRSAVEVLPAGPESPIAHPHPSARSGQVGCAGSALRLCGGSIPPCCGSIPSCWGSNPLGNSRGKRLVRGGVRAWGRRCGCWCRYSRQTWRSLGSERRLLLRRSWSSEPQESSWRWLGPRLCRHGWRLKRRKRYRRDEAALATP